MSIPFRQQPYWEKDVKFEIEPEEFATLMSTYEQFSYTLQTIYNRLVESGHLKMKYYDDFDNELDETTVRTMMNNFNSINEEKAPN